MAETSVSVLSQTSCHLGEGPTFDPVSGTLFWFDILDKRLHQMRWPDGDTVTYELPEMASALAVVDEQRQVLVTETGLHIRHAATGALSLHAPIEAENAATRSNDARVHPCGAFWISTMGKQAENRAGAIYWFFKGALRRLYRNMTIPNSICFSPDGGTAYFADTAEGVINRVDCDAETGLPRGAPHPFVEGRGEGGFDGSVVDAQGVLWNACWGAGTLDAYGPSGEKLNSIAMPARQVTCPAFVGPEATGIAVTSAREGLDEAALQADPEAGKTFLVDLPVRGRFEPRLLL
ncbi:MAG TPA: SMP-30/gluconolactonase/LRE family protein [Pararhizobium sp.]|nr:SMP-30/gluconolactonase/LRE family protein [Pararhizobium sp.]